MPDLPSLLPVVAFAAAASWAFAAEPAGHGKKSPFLPVVPAGTAAVMADETIEFAGVSVVGAKTDLIFHDKASKKNRWVPLGETVEGITALNYDARREQAVVKINGTEKVLALRKAAGPANAPAPVTVMPAAAGFSVPPPNVVPAGADTTATPAAPQTPPAGPQTEVQKQETEARMLVSDLLEIGMAQRKAYEEAQRKAAEAEAPPPGGAANPAPKP
jgi:hypothetical protein